MSQGWTATSMASIGSTPHSCSAYAYAPAAGFQMPASSTDRNLSKSSSTPARSSSASATEAAPC